MRLTGGCQCGAIRYSMSRVPDEPHICHCRMCQKASGNYFMPLASLTLDEFEITRGEPSWFHSSDPVRRGFCKDCGTPLLFETVGYNKIYMTLGSLDEPDKLQPTSASGSQSKMPWIAEICEWQGSRTDDEAMLDGHPVEIFTQTNKQHPDHDVDDWPVKATNNRT